MMDARRVWLTVFVTLSALVSAQDVQFSQFYTVALYQNPAFAGSAHFHRGLVHNRIQWPNLDGKYTTYFASYDGYSRRYKSGFGAYVMQDYMGSNNISTSELHLVYSYEVEINNKWTFRPGLQAGLGQRYLDYSRLRFPQNYDDNGFVPGSGSPQINSFIFYPDVSSGFLLYNDNLWFGYSSHHLNRPNLSMLNNIERLPIKHALTAGYKIMLHQKTTLNYATSDQVEVSITPTIHYKFQGKADQTDIGLYGIYDWFLFGIWYRGIPFKTYEKISYVNNESMIAQVGFRWDRWTFNYSYDFTVSKLGGPRQTGGSHEMNITYVMLPIKKPQKPTKRLPCPNFQKDIILEDMRHW